MDRSSKNEHMAVEPETAQMNLESNYHQESSYEKSRFRCDGRILCSQMNSYAEALFFLNIEHVEFVSTASIISLYSLESQILKSLDSLCPIFPSETIERWHSMLLSHVNVPDSVKNAHKDRTTQRFQRIS